MSTAENRIERLQLIDPRRFEPWVLSAYDRPISAGRAWVPVGWPERATAWKLDPDEIESYRRRASLALDPVRVLDLQLELDPARHAQTLPPQLDPGHPPRLRVLALAVERSDLSTQPFEEVWLLGRCEHSGKEAWYALAHIAGPGGDVVYGRETFGYPSKTGAIEWRERDHELSIRGHRLGRTFLRLRTALERDARPSADSATRAALLVLGLRLHPPYRRMTLHGFTEPGAQADLVAQPWALELERAQPIDPAALVLELPAAPGPGTIGAPDPWYEFAGAGVVAASYGRGALLRAPGQNAGPVSNYLPHYRERYDGASTSAEAISGDLRHTFLVTPSESP